MLSALKARFLLLVRRDAAPTLADATNNVRPAIYVHSGIRGNYLTFVSAEGGRTFAAKGGAGVANYVTFLGALTANNPSITATGDDANVGLYVQTKGTGEMALRNGNGEAVVLVSNGGLGFFGTAPTPQGDAITDVPAATVGAGADSINLAALQTDLGEIRTRVNLLISRLEANGLIAT